VVGNAAKVARYLAALWPNGRSDVGIRTFFIAKQVVVLEAVVPNGLSAEDLQNEFDDFLVWKGCKQ
jgi:hypothetical protein